MEDRPVEEIPTNIEPTSELTATVGPAPEAPAMTEPAKLVSATAEPAKSSRKGVTVKSLIALVACCGAVLYAVRSVREGMQPTLGWVRTLHSGSVEDRQIAAHQLGQADPKDLKMAVPALVAGLGDKNEAVRAAAAFALGNAGLTAMKTKADQAEAREAALALTRVLTDSDEDVRVTAAVALGHFANAAKTGGFPTEPGPMAVALVGLLDSPSLKVRKLGCQALAQISSAAPIEPPPSLIAGLSRWELPECRAIAASALGFFKTGTESAVAALTKALKDADPLVRSNAAVSLQKYGAESSTALPLLVATLDDSFIPPPPPPPRFPGVVAAPSPGGASGPADIPADPVLHAAEAIGRIGEAVVAKEGTLPPEVATGLTKALQSTRPAVKEAAEEALRRIGKGASAAVPGLTKLLVEWTPKADEGLGSSAATAMGEVAPGTSMAVDAISALILALDSKNSTTRSNVIKALGKFGKAAEAALGRLQAIQDSDKELASTARNAIDRIEGKAPPDAPRRKRGGGRRGSDAPARP